MQANHPAAAYLSSAEREMLSSLDEALGTDSASAYMRDIATELLARIGSSGVIAMEAVSLDRLGLSAFAPESVGSCRVVAYPPGSRGKAERHPNSHQRVLSIRGSGVVKVMMDGWHAWPISEDAGGTIESRWVSLPPNVWHQPFAESEPWVVLALHSVTEGELIDEYQ